MCVFVNVGDCFMLMNIILSIFISWALYLNSPLSVLTQSFKHRYCGRSKT